MEQSPPIPKNSASSATLRLCVKIQPSWGLSSHVAGRESDILTFPPVAVKAKADNCS